MAGILTERQFEAISKFGEGVGAALQDRFHQKQYEDFTKNELAQFVSQGNELKSALLQEEDPDAMAALFKQYSTLSNEFLTNAGKYANNPYIANVAQQIYQANVNGLSEFMQVQEGTEAFAGREEQRERAVRKEEADIELSEARAEEARASALRQRREAMQPEGAGGAAVLLTQGAANPQQARALLYRTDKSHFQTIREDELNRTRQALAQQEVARRRARGETKPLGGLWGDDPDDWKIIAANEISADEVRKKWEIDRLSTEGWNPYDPTFGGRYLPPEEVTEQTVPRIRGQVSDYEIGSFLLGHDALEIITGKEIGPGKELSPGRISVADLARNLPDDLGSLPNSPFKEAFAFVASARGYNPITDKPWESYDEMLAFIKAVGEARLMHLIGGEDTPDKELTKPARTSRQKARQLLDTMIAKYGPQLGSAFELPGYRPPKEKGILGDRPLLVERAATKAAQLVRGLLYSEDVVE